VNSTSLPTDFLIIGSGAAGLQAAWHASQYGNVTLVTKSTLEASSSYWAQGGIAAVLRSTDSFQSHKDDTLDAGRGLCNEEAVDLLVEEGARHVQELIDYGMSFDETNGSLDMGLEGGHSNRRVLHANGAATGKALVKFLAKQVKAQQNIRIIENAFVFELLRSDGSCQGANAYLYEENRLLTVKSPVTILATGGYSGLYQRSTNPHTSTGDGLWLAYDIGVELQDLELVQFHPTAFYAEDGSTFLISEAIRGEGAYLYNDDGERFMMGYPQQELSPRDMVSKEILQQIRQSEKDYVYLDVRHLDIEKLRTHFPNIIEKIERQGIDIEKEGIPVAPAAHYCIGGIATNLDAQTLVEGLYACGEVAATGVHGANRLASNSLLECLVFAKRAVEHAADSSVKYKAQNSARDIDFFVNSNIENQFIHLQNFVSAVLSQHVGIIRDGSGMKKALDQLNAWEQKLPSDSHEYFAVRSRGLLGIAELITRSALQREESRGVHLRSDFPEKRSGVSHILHKSENKHMLEVSL
jgi:L-aspartate oxidase